MDAIVAQQDGEPIHLLQTAGSGAERSFCVLPLQRAIIGRSDSAAVFIDEDGISRQHALIEHQEGAAWVIDLGSTNGTFVNGEQIDNSELQSGDRLQVGSAVFEVTVGKTDEPDALANAKTDPQLKQQIAQINERLQEPPTGSGPIVIQKTVLAGNLTSIGLPSLLQTLESNRNSGSLVIRLQSQVGQIYLDNGRPIHAELGPTSGKKALVRMVSLNDGDFELVAPGYEPVLPTITGQLDGLLLEAVTQNDEFTLYRTELPPDDATLDFAPNRFFVLHRMRADLFEVLACIARFRTVGAVIDGCSLSDLNVCRHLLMLLNEGIITVGADEP
jgi:pSer/pThr/pTyr-binding forkhead associated (FHA) protein